jgi:predicted DNA-binding protein with PD1-like motif
MKVYSLRLKPDQDLRFELEKFAHDKGIQAGFVMTCVGSLVDVNLRMPGATPDNKIYKTLKGHFEIVSLVGIVSINGSHLHMSVSDENGQVLGGHLTEENILYATAEIVIGEDETVTYTRKHDDQTGFPELTIKPRG